MFVPEQQAVHLEQVEVLSKILLFGRIFVIKW